MARQLVDLPRMTAEDLADDDLLLVRDVSSKKDKRVLLADLLSLARIDPADLLDMIYPVGATIETTDNTYDPEEVFGGTWTLERSNQPKRELVATQELFNGKIERTSAGTTNLIGAYNENLIEGIWQNLTIPTGYHKEYRISCQVSTSSSNTAQFGLNNIRTNSDGTYSGDTFRKIVASGYFKYSDITLETTVGYNRPGINAKVISSGSGNAWFWQGSLLAYVVSDVKYYVWRRTA